MTLPETTALDLERDGGWLTVWFNEPAIRNPLTAARAADLTRLCEALAGDRSVRGVTFRGRGGMFSAGGDLKAFKTVFQGGAKREDVLTLSRDGARVFDLVNALPRVTVMAVEGAAMAGGMGLACCGDVVIAERDAKFAFTQTMIGLSPAQISPFVLQRLGARLGRRLMLTGASVAGEEALSVGMADILTDGPGEMDAAIAKVRGAVRRCAPEAVAGTKALILAMPGLDRAAQIEAAAENFADRMLSDEGREGVASFVAKRKPEWAER